MKRVILISLIVLLVYGFLIEPNLLVVQKVKIKDANLHGIKAVFAGDFHFQPFEEQRLQYIVKKINEQKPDLILCTGDFVNEDNDILTLSPEIIAKHLADLKPKYGTFTVLGNHDWWLNGKRITTELEKAGITVLANSHTKINISGKDVYIAGIEDLLTRRPNIFAALKDTKNPTILLTHTPDIFDIVPQTVNLTLAGHIHGGQVRLPYIGALIVPSLYGNKYSLGLIEENGKKLYVTKGIGTSIIPVRFNCLPEIVVIEFE